MSKSGGNVVCGKVILSVESVCHSVQTQMTTTRTYSNWFTWRPPAVPFPYRDPTTCSNLFSPHFATNMGIPEACYQLFTFDPLTGRQVDGWPSTERASCNLIVHKKYSHRWIWIVKRWHGDVWLSHADTPPKMKWLINKSADASLPLKLS